MNLPKPVIDLIEKFEKLPGIGPKSAQRLVFYLLRYPKNEIQDFAQKLVDLKQKTTRCSVCHNITQNDPCDICTDSQRDRTKLCIVENSLDLIAIEKTGKYKGLYHVLNGLIDPLNYVGPEQIYLFDIVKRLEGVKEVIFALSSTLEGESTTLYIVSLIKKHNKNIKLTRLGYGLPVGADVEYTDTKTLSLAFETRKELE